ncbi:hypothetical protein [Sorangium sp. So ce854]|uniref:hypothetical protein n=1 Tax=Sorangium sp. So ce854 TaxID=3133322 RepID=UPI003F5F6BF7
MAIVALGCAACSPRAREFLAEGGGGSAHESASSGTGLGGGGEQDGQGAGGDGGHGGHSPATCDPTDVADAGDGVFVSKLASSGFEDGSAVAPMTRLAAGIELARARGRSAVYVAPGVYDETVVLPPGLHLRGGWRVDANLDWRRDCTEDAASKVVIVARGVEAPVVTVDRASDDEGTAPVIIEALTISTTGDVTGPLPGEPGASLVGLLVRGGIDVTLERVSIRTHAAGAGGPVAAGTMGAAAETYCKQTECHDGLVGESGAAATPALPGSWGQDGRFTPGDGSPGGPGATGHSGTPGGPETCFETEECVSGCTPFPECAPRFRDEPTCSQPGQCGCGGFGGGGGEAGRGGGASAALVAVGATTSVLLRGTSLSAGKGGDASAGAPGGLGGVGSSGAPGLDSGYCSLGACFLEETRCEYDRGAREFKEGGSAGGNGGPGGPGASGSPGAGGPSLAVVMVGGASVTVERSELTASMGGSGEPAGVSAARFDAP